MLRLHALGSNTETGVPYTEEEIMAIIRKGKQRGHLLGVGRVLPGQATNGCPAQPQSTVDPVDVEKLKKSNKSLTKQVKMMMRLFRSDDNLPETMRAPPSRSGKSPGNEFLASFPLQLIPGDMSPGIGFPSDKSPGKAWKCRWGL
ncbi:hypothetical protein Tco_0061417, partial [Tanacetum coccineum]